MAKDAKGHGSEARSVRAGSYDGKPVFHGVVGGQKVTNKAGNPIAYASPEAALAGANSVGGGEAKVASIADQHGVPTGHLPWSKSGTVPPRFDHGASGHPDSTGSSYHKGAVDNAIASSNRAGRRIGGKEAKAIHALLKGRG